MNVPKNRPIRSRGRMIRKFIRPPILMLMVMIILVAGFVLTSRLAGASRAPAASAPAQAQTIRYTYDDAGRLVQVDYGTGVRITYTYDNAGNLRRREVVGGR